MKLEEVIKKIGGISPLYDIPSNLNREEINKLEGLLSSKLPIEYESFLLNYGVFSPNEYVVFSPLQRDSQVDKILKEEGFSQPIFESSSIDVFFGKGEDVYDVFFMLDIVKDRIPDNFLPIASDGMGNLILISLDKKSFQEVYFWHHEYEWDEEDYLEETGKIMPPEIKFQNIWKLGNSFVDFLDRCYIYNFH